MQANFQLLHGNIRGLERVPSSPQFEGRFGRMFRTLKPACFDEEDLKKLASAMIAPQKPPPPQGQDNPEENTAISAGYTYLGQFIDHDLTFDPASSLQRDNDPDALVDYRTPRFDLDCLYGRGPDDQPYLYEFSRDEVRMLLGRPLRGNQDDPNTRDLPRYEHKRALIGDPRNDENVIVAQLHAIFLRFHNRIVNWLKEKGERAEFRTVQRLVRWHYQWVVLNDFLPTIIGVKMLYSILPHLEKLNLGKPSSILQDKPNLQFYTWWDEPFIPAEFSVAAYRFGHSMVRPIYQLNTSVAPQVIFSQRPTQLDLRGFREFPNSWAIEWQRFFQMPRTPATTEPQLTYKIDSSLIYQLGELPDSVAPHTPSLAERDLLRGLRMGLPSGQVVAKAMGEVPICDNKLRVGPATKEGSTKNPCLVALSKKFRNNAPLWYYILAEAQQAFQCDKTPIRLGPVGGRIVGEVFAGLLLGDPYSFLNQEPHWQPIAEFQNNQGKFGMAELIAQAMQA